MGQGTFPEIAILFLGSVGIVFIIVHSNILQKPREYLQSKSKFFKELLNCSLCVGVWVGAATSILSAIEALSPILVYFYIPFAVSALAYFYDRLVILIDNLADKSE